METQDVPPAKLGDDVRRTSPRWEGQGKRLNQDEEPDRKPTKDRVTGRRGTGDGR